MPPLTGPTRREALKLFSAGAASLVAGCSEPEDEIVPYIAQPEGLVPGQPMFFATALPLGGAGRGVIVESHEGRPTKVHGNPAHPASQGATDVFAEAAILDLFDPHRPRAPRQGTIPVSWLAFETALPRGLPPDGKGARLLTGPVASPTMARQIAALLERRPQMRWHAARPPATALEMPLGDGRLRMWPAFDRVTLAVSLGCDFLGPGPGQIATARAFAEARAVRPDALRLEVFEPSPSLTGAKADRRVMAGMAELAALAEWLEMRLGGTGSAPLPPPRLRDLAEATALRLERAGAGALVLAAPELPPQAALAVARLNARLGAPLDWRPTADTWAGLRPDPVGALADDMQAGDVTALVVLDADPVHDLPSAGFADAMRHVPLTVFGGVTFNDTAAHCDWRLPLAHPLEDWSDLRGPDGTVALVQPLIAPLHGSRSRHEVLDLLVRGPAAAAPARTILRETWQAARDADGPEFEAFWTRALHEGVIEGTAFAPISPDLDADPFHAPFPADEGFELLLRPSSSVWTGAGAGNAWLQECPEPVTKQVWGNAVWMAPADALRMGLEDGNAVRIGGRGGTVEAPVLILKGQHEGTLSMALGYGRRMAGPIGSDVGANAAILSPPGGATVVTGVTVTPTGSRLPVHRTQHHFEQGPRDILRSVPASDPTLDAAGPQPSFYPPWNSAPNAWAMVIDLDRCIGCNACLVACQSENNVPVVGPEEIDRGRVMHWLRIDAYERDDGAPSFQPIPCMHCEKAPCEPVCPVAASVHDGQGLNVQVYNRCVGTRFCQANCPYKVRRFNFFDYANGQPAIAGRVEDVPEDGADLLAALRNPEVTVRARGVMEKCTYCVQRIERAHHEAARENRPIPPGAVRTACQDACPTVAITFGDLNADGSAVARLREDPRHYALLGELGTRPRTTYLARIEDRDPGERA
ncbi:4Fe-4S ferredoxin, iron-sulfur binding protein [Oceaniovalibus guishaninsula JLT2003]|uniref:4Fe-4S ferredoxin, iron-sulfur binding protein n=1 Tax=Oceaniovalibus guishaninsula JLT2003 TaxID=1231392 RepID=K2GPM9_9RHOB|nr:4Fe-4S dicluster domain-containing protein [Oceaniovalibus guishaninsula]EKE44611.1 4Fe-4S ferredoxin, iron-sulfur binding protein [Oceaniovalibus guishaninsula JLT2003]